MIKTGIDIALKPLHWEKKDNKKGHTGLVIIRALNVQLAPEVYSYYQIERQTNTGICYLSVVVENDGSEEEFYMGLNSMDMGELMELAEKDRVKNIGDLVKYTLSPADIAKTLNGPALKHSTTTALYYTTDMSEYHLGSLPLAICQRSS